MNRSLLFAVVVVLFSVVIQTTLAKPERNYCLENVNRARKALNLKEFNFDAALFKKFSSVKKCLSNQDVAGIKGFTVATKNEAQDIPMSMLGPEVRKFTCYDTQKCEGIKSDITFFFLANGL